MPDPMEGGLSFVLQAGRNPRATLGPSLLELPSMLILQSAIVLLSLTPIAKAGLEASRVPDFWPELACRVMASPARGRPQRSGVAQEGRSAGRAGVRARGGQAHRAVGVSRQCHPSAARASADPPRGVT